MQVPQSPLDLLSFPGAKMGKSSAVIDEFGALARAGESGALADLAKVAGKGAGVKGQAAEEALTRAILQKQAAGPRAKTLDYSTVLDPKAGKNLEQMSKEIQKKKLAEEIKKLLKK